MNIRIFKNYHYLKIYFQDYIYSKIMIYILNLLTNINKQFNIHYLLILDTLFSSLIITSFPSDTGITSKTALSNLRSNS